MFPTGRRPKPLIFGLEHVPLPAAVCNRRGVIHWVNERLMAALGTKEAPIGLSLEDMALLGGRKRPWPKLDQLERENGTPEVVLGDRMYTLYLSQIDDFFGCVFAPDSRAPLPALLETQQVSPPSGARLLEAFIALSRELSLTMREEELVDLFVQTFERLFPGRLFCFQLADPETLEARQLHASASLKCDPPQLALTESARHDHGLGGADSEWMFAKGALRSLEQYETVFQDSACGFDVPLFDGSKLYGILNVEYLQQRVPMAADMALVVPLAQQMCAAFRNARLLAEMLWLKDYLAKLLDRANAPVIVVDKQRKITVVNQAFERQTGHDRKEIIGTDLLSLVREDEQSSLLPAVVAAMRGEPRSNVEVRIPRADGETVAHVAFNTAALHSQFGELESVIFVGQDLTEIRALQKQIIHSEKLATLGQVAAGVAHELNNPLTSITVYASYLAKMLKGKIADTDHAKLQRIVEAASRIQSFTRDLVAYARPSGEQPTSIRISELVGRAVSFCEHVIAAHKAQLTVLVPENLIQVFGIHGQLEQVFVNLITNACHALPQGGGEIRITARQRDRDKIEITVEDNGCGILPEHQGAVFEPFFTTKPEGQGTGLGLSIVRNILTNHNATIEVDSEVGKCTAFRIVL